MSVVENGLLSLSFTDERSRKKTRNKKRFLNVCSPKEENIGLLMLRATKEWKKTKGHSKYRGQNSADPDGNTSTLNIRVQFRNFNPLSGPTCLDMDEERIV